MILQVNFKLNVSVAEYDHLTRVVADAFANVPGLLWKIWILNEQQQEAGGIYLFDSEASLDAFLSGPLAAQVKSLPALRDVSMKRFSVMSDVTALTRGPVSAPALATA